MTWVQRCEWLCMHIILWLLTLAHTLASTSPHRSAACQERNASVNLAGTAMQYNENCETLWSALAPQV